MGQQVYGPYGNTRYQVGSLSTTKGYTGQFHDAVSGLDYYHARYYDPVVGQFLSVDDVEGNVEGMDPYAYMTGNPETLTDPTGLATSSTSTYCISIYIGVIFGTIAITVCITINTGISDTGGSTNIGGGGGNFGGGISDSAANFGGGISNGGGDNNGGGISDSAANFGGGISNGGGDNNGGGNNNGGGISNGNDNPGTGGIGAVVIAAAVIATAGVGGIGGGGIIGGGGGIVGAELAGGAGEIGGAAFGGAAFARGANFGGDDGTGKNWQPRNKNKRPPNRKDTANQKENSDFERAVKTIEREIGRKLSKDEIQRWHRAISKEHYDLKEIIAIGEGMFKYYGDS